MFRANVEDFGEKCSLKDIEWIMKIQKKVALTQLLLHLRHAKGIVSHYFQYNFELFEFRSGSHPTIAQLAERETVEAKQLSLGHWFESGWSEIFFTKFPNNIKLYKKFPTDRIRTSDLEITA